MWRWTSKAGHLSCLRLLNHWGILMFTVTAKNLQGAKNSVHPDVYDKCHEYLIYRPTQKTSNTRQTLKKQFASYFIEAIFCPFAQTYIKSFSSWGYELGRKRNALHSRVTDKTYEDVWDNTSQEEIEYYKRKNLQRSPEERYQDSKRCWYFHKSSWYMRGVDGYDGKGCNNGVCVPECRSTWVCKDRRWRRYSKA